MDKILVLINKIENLLIAIENNGAMLWHPDLQNTSNCIIVYKDIKILVPDNDIDNDLLTMTG